MTGEVSPKGEREQFARKIDETAHQMSNHSCLILIDCFPDFRHQGPPCLVSLPRSREFAVFGVFCYVSFQIDSLFLPLLKVIEIIELNAQSLQIRETFQIHQKFFNRSRKNIDDIAERWIFGSILDVTRSVSYEQHFLDIFCISGIRTYSFDRGCIVIVVAKNQRPEDLRGYKGSEVS